MALVIGVSIVGAGTVIGAAAYMFKRKLQRLPRNSPAAYLQKTSKKAQFRLVCIGDSLTHGTMSANYCKLLQKCLEQHFGDDAVDVINAGINGQCVCSMVDRLDAISMCSPTHVIVLAGTNDVKGCYKPEWGAKSVQEWPSMPGPPTMPAFKEDYARLLERVGDFSPSVRLAVTTLPMLGEDLGSEANSYVRETNAFIQQQASVNGLSVLPLFERLSDLLLDTSKSSADASASAESIDSFQSNMVTCIFKFYVCGRSWKQTGASYGYRVLTDGIHLNEDGAQVMADLASHWVKTSTEV
jgi:lysophospholipase L1-like esterase